MKIFDIENNKVVINENVLLIPSLRIVNSKYKDNLNALSYCHYMTDYIGAYSEFTEDAKSDKIYGDFPGDYHPDDPEIVACIDFLNDARFTTITRYWFSLKTLTDNLSLYMQTARIDDSKETGNITHILNIVKNCGKALDEYKKVEKAREEDIQKSRGDKDLPYDM